MRILLVLLALALLAGWVRYSGGFVGTRQAAEPSVPTVSSSLESGADETVTLALPAEGSSGEGERSLALPSRLRPPVLTRGVPRDESEAPVAEKPRAVEEAPLQPEPPPPLDGPVLRAHYANGRIEYLGSQVLREDGEWVRDGDWEAWHENGQVHEMGAYRLGREHGEWQWWYADGQPMAIGSFVDGERDGRWSWWHENGQLMMEGSYRLGLRVGTWRAFETDGTSGVATAEGDETSD